LISVAPDPIETQTVRTFTALGVGRHGLAVINHLLTGRRWRLVSVYDQSAAAYARFQFQFHERRIPFYATSVEALAERPDLVYIAATAPAHVPLAEVVLSAGFSGRLLIEKPIATSLRAAEALHTRVVALSAGDRVAVNFNRRCSWIYQSAKAVIESGELGRLRHIDYKRSMKLSMKGSHYIDLINWYLGARPKKVTARLANRSSVDTRGAYFFDPAGYLEIEYEHGQTACVDGLEQRSDLALGMVLRFDHGTIQISADEQATHLAGPNGERNLAHEPGSTTYDWIGNTFDALVAPGGRFRPCSLPEAIDCLAVIVAAHQSHRAGGRPIDLPLEPAVRAEEMRLA
jgi:predicted dehydrogenase